MGAWGSGSFENDTAMDWAAEIQSVDDVRRPFERLKALGSNLLDVDLACEVVAAAETIAMMMGRKSADFPDELARRLAGTGEPDSELYQQTRSALFQVMRNSELAELWQEGVEEGGENEWLAAMTGLVDRLNPDLEKTPWSPEEIEHHVGQALQTCAFCDRPVAADDLFLMTIYDASNRAPGDRGMWLHLRCLNSRLHHRHAVINLKFDPENLRDMDKL